jgi:RNA polymerase sigma-70 factor (ECF subfamily)
MTVDRELEDFASPHGSTSRSLLAEAKHADPAAWERLVKLYAPLVAWWCRRWGVAEQDVGDVLQDVFSAVFHRFDRFRKEQPADTFRGWLLTIARNKTHDHFRRLAHEPAAPGGTEASLRLSQAPDPEAIGSALDAGDPAVFNSILVQALDAIRGEFHERTWQAFWKVVVEGRETADVAAALQMQPGAVRVSKSRVLMRLRRELGDASE